MEDYLQYKVDLDDPEIAAIFDELPFWSSRFGALLLRHIEFRPNIRILDLGCATGFPLLEMAQVFGRSCQVIGLDIWQQALNRARAKLRIYDLPNVAILRADGAQMPFENDEFDLIVSNLGLNNFTDPAAVVSECFRVARPGGRIALTTNVRGHMREFYGVFRETLNELEKPEYIERLTAHEAHRGTKESLCALLTEAGFKVAKVVEDDFCIRYLDGSVMLNHSLTKLGFMDGWKSVIDPGDWVEVFGIIERELNRAASEKGELSMTIPMLYLEGVKST